MKSKRTLTLLLALALCLYLCACGKKVSDNVKNAITEKCDSFVEEITKEGSYLSGLYKLNSISYEIDEISPGGKSSICDYFVGITWYVDVSSDVLNESCWADDWYSAVAYVLSDEGITVDGKVMSISHSKNEYYDLLRIVVNGGTPYSWANSEISTDKPEDSFGHDKFDAITIAEEIVKNNLKSPSTANFCSTKETTVSCSDNSWAVSGYVDAQNSFGATLRNTYTVKFTFTSFNRYTVDSCIIK